MHKRYIPILMLWATLVGCTTEFDEVNINNNAPEQVTPSLLLPTIERGIVNRVVGIALGTEVGSLWSQHMAQVQYPLEDQYEVEDVTSQSGWGFYTSSSMDAANMVRMVEAAKGNQTYAHIGRILLAYSYAQQTDMFGPIPYSKAVSGSVDYFPAYTAQRDIYMDLVAQLEKASLGLDLGSAVKPGSDDILLGGDLLKWKKFANGLRLRLLVRMSGVEQAFAQTEIAKMVADPAKYPLPLTSADDVALKYAAFPSNNPNNENRKTRFDYRLSKNFVDRLLSAGDARLMAFAGLNQSNDIAGLPNGLSASAANAIGAKNVSDMSKDYMLTETYPGYLLTASEVNFLLAESAKRGLIGGGDAKAQQYYEEGVRQSFLQHKTVLEKRFAEAGDTSTGYGAYAQKHAFSYTSVDEEVIRLLAGPYKYNSAKALEQIATQKWVALFGQGLEAWSEWRRTGFPAPYMDPKADFKNGGKTPVRLPYPMNESSLNAVSFQAALKTLSTGQNDLNAKMWWMK